MLKIQDFQGVSIPKFNFLGSEKAGFGSFLLFGGNGFGAMLIDKCQKEGQTMRKKGYKGRCEKRMLRKCKDICRTYDPIQFLYAEILEQNEDVQEFQCNVLLDGLSEGEYTSDFFCIKTNGDMMVRECVPRKHLMKPMTVRLLDASREYWHKRGVTDWGLVIDAEK